MKLEENLLSTIEKNSVTKKPLQTATIEVVLCDECGDSLWDAVLAQDEKNSALQQVCKIPSTK